MKITKTYLKEIILEEIKKVREGLSSSRYWALRNLANGTNRRKKEEEESKEDEKEKDKKEDEKDKNEK